MFALESCYAVDTMQRIVAIRAGNVAFNLASNLILDRNSHKWAEYGSVVVNVSPESHSGQVF